MTNREININVKKTVRSNSNSTIASLLNQNPMQSPVSDSNEYVPVFFSEISDIMRGFGDAPRPQRESVILVEKILLKQLKGILQDAIDCAVERKGKPSPSQSDFEFLMRKNPVKINRLRKYLRDVKLQRKYEELQHGRVHIESMLDNNEENSDEDMIEDEQEIHDEEKVRRLFRADRISQTLSGEDYDEFNIARRVSFNCRNSSVMRNRFRGWLNISNEILLSQHALVILSYLAHETIATLVDFCILSRLNPSNRSTEPYVRVSTPGTYYDMLHLCPEVTQGRGIDGAKSITPQEIHESMRRFVQSTTATMGHFRNSKSTQQIYLAL